MMDGLPLQNRATPQSIFAPLRKASPSAMETKLRRPYLTILAISFLWGTPLKGLNAQVSNAPPLANVRLLQWNESPLMPA